MDRADLHLAALLVGVFGLYFSSSATGRTAFGRSCWDRSGRSGSGLVHAVRAPEGARSSRFVPTQRASALWDAATLPVAVVPRADFGLRQRIAGRKASQVCPLVGAEASPRAPPFLLQL